MPKIQDWEEAEKSVSKKDPKRMEVPHWSRLLVEGTVTCISLISLYLNREQEAASVRLTLAYICTIWPYLKTVLGSAHPLTLQPEKILNVVFICVLVLLVYTARSLPLCFSKKLYKSVSKGLETVGFLEKEEEPCPSSGWGGRAWRLVPDLLCRLCCGRRGFSSFEIDLLTLPPYITPADVSWLPRAARCPLILHGGVVFQVNPSFTLFEIWDPPYSCFPGVWHAPHAEQRSSEGREYEECALRNPVLTSKLFRESICGTLWLIWET